MSASIGASNTIVKFVVEGLSVRRENTTTFLAGDDRDQDVTFRDFSCVLGCTETHITWGEKRKSGRWDGKILIQDRPPVGKDSVTNRTVENVPHEIVEWKGNP